MLVDRSESCIALMGAERQGPGNASPVHTRQRWYLPIKAAIEWLIALAVFVAVMPILMLLAVLVRMSSHGPAFYSQARVGRNGRVFLMHKLRSMQHQCEAKTGPVWSLPNDSRITNVGRFLRKTHLDELPQLINVIQGHMSLIGPRPERPELAVVIEKTIPQFRERLKFRPGLTGLAQTQLPSDTGMHTVRKKLAYDLYYVRQVNPFLDLRIAVSTALYLFSVTVRAVGVLLVSSYGAAAENDPDASELMNAEEYEPPPTTT